nr:patatin-like phospholipase family protein [Nocardia tengchongensis]
MSGTGTKSVDLVLEGGGVKGIALVGAVLSLAEAGYRFERIAGTSAGAVVGALTAAYQQAGRDLGDLHPIMQSLDYRRFEDGSIAQRARSGGSGTAWPWCFRTARTPATIWCGG